MACAEALLHFLELDDYLSGQAIPATVLSEENVDCRDGGQRVLLRSPS